MSGYGLRATDRSFGLGTVVVIGFILVDNAPEYLTVQHSVELLAYSWNPPTGGAALPSALMAAAT